MASTDSNRSIAKLTGVYDANGSLSGELAYWFGARLGRRHCALCDVTHGLVRAKPEWLRLADELPVEFSAVHLDERDPIVEAASRGLVPCVVATFDDGTSEVLIEREQIEACEGDPQRFYQLLVDASERQNEGAK